MWKRKSDEMPATESVEIDTSGTTVRVQRRRGAVAGILLMVLGAWAAVAPFIGPSFHFGFTPDNANWTSARGWLEVVPGALVVIAGNALLMTTNRILAAAASWAAIAGGGWLVIGPQIAPIVNVGSMGSPLGSTQRMHAAENLLLFYALGATIIALGAIAFGRVSARTVGDVRAAQVRAAVAERQARHAAALQSKQRLEVPMEVPAPLPTTDAPPRPTGDVANDRWHKRHPGADYPPAPPPHPGWTEEQPTEQVDPAPARGSRRH